MRSENPEDREEAALDKMFQVLAAHFAHETTPLTEPVVALRADFNTRSTDTAKLNPVPIRKSRRIR